MQLKIFLLVPLLFVLFAGCDAAAQAPLASPTGAAENFYKTYLRLQVRGLPNKKQLKSLSPLMTRDLKELFESAARTQAKFIREHPDEKPPWIEGDLFTSLFEGAQSFRLGAATVSGNRAEVLVNLEYHEGGSSSRWSDVLVLVRDRNRWLISDILLKGEWQFKAGDSLRRILSSE